MSLSEKTFLQAGLYVIAVPIGNLQDITLRALETLKNVHKIYCEDTRVTKKLLGLYNIQAPDLIRCDSYQEHAIIDHIADDIQNGLAIALVSDAGTPLISDPGYVIISQLREKKLPIYPIVGACAAISALSVSGLPTQTFQFKGFIPKKQSERLKLIDNMAAYPDTYIFYERPERLVGFLQLLPDIFSECLCFIAREMTKRHEEYSALTVEQTLIFIQNMSHKGEAVFILNTNAIASNHVFDLEAAICDQLKQGYSVKEISRNKDLLKYAPRNTLYENAQTLKNKGFHS